MIEWNYFKILSIPYRLIMIGKGPVIHLLGEKWTTFELDRTCTEKQPLWVWTVGTLGICPGYHHLVHIFHHICEIFFNYHVDYHVNHGQSISSTVQLRKIQRICSENNYRRYICIICNEHCSCHWRSHPRPSGDSCLLTFGHQQ